MMEENILSNFEINRFPDNSIKIIRPNGEEVNEFFDKTIQKKDKNGNIRTII